MLIIGPVPPPYMGPSMATEILMNSGLADAFDLVHLDTSHHKGLDTFGAINWRNVTSAFRHAFQLAAMILKCRPDIVYVPISQTTIGYLKDSLFILLAKVLGRNVVCHLRGAYFRKWLKGAGGIVRWYVSRVHSLVDAQIVLGECLRPLFAGLVPEDRIFVVPNGRDFEWSPPQDEMTSSGRLRVLYLGNIIKTKGVLDVLRAAPMVKDAGCEAQFLFAGGFRDETIKAEMEKGVRNYGEDLIKLLGPVVGQRKSDVLLNADIFVFPTYFRFEGHPWVIVEAMAAGLPIVTTDHAAIRESVVSGVNGFLVEKESPSAVAEKIIELCRDTELRKRMGAASVERYQQYFTEAAMVRAMTAALQSAAPEPD